MGAHSILIPFSRGNDRSCMEVSSNFLRYSWAVCNTDFSTGGLQSIATPSVYLWLGELLLNLHDSCCDGDELELQLDNNER
jgi:hypothetical protein